MKGRTLKVDKSLKTKFTISIRSYSCRRRDWDKIGSGTTENRELRSRTSSFSNDANPSQSPNKYAYNVFNTRSLYVFSNRNSGSSRRSAARVGKNGVPSLSGENYDGWFFVVVQVFQSLNKKDTLFMYQP